MPTGRCGSRIASTLPDDEQGHAGLFLPQFQTAAGGEAVQFFAAGKHHNDSAERGAGRRFFRRPEQILLAIDHKHAHAFGVDPQSPQTWAIQRAMLLRLGRERCNQHGFAGAVCGACSRKRKGCRRCMIGRILARHLVQAVCK